jgi:hypothetical protein
MLLSGFHPGPGALDQGPLLPFLGFWGHGSVSAMLNTNLSSASQYLEDAIQDVGQLLPIAGSPRPASLGPCPGMRVGLISGCSSKAPSPRTPQHSHKHVHFIDSSLAQMCGCEQLH